MLSGANRSSEGGRRGRRPGLWEEEDARRTKHPWGPDTGNTEGCASPHLVGRQRRGAPTCAGREQGGAHPSGEKRESAEEGESRPRGKGQSAREDGRRERGPPPPSGRTQRGSAPLGASRRRRGGRTSSPGLPGAPAGAPLGVSPRPTRRWAAVTSCYAIWDGSKAGENPQKGTHTSHDRRVALGGPLVCARAPGALRCACARA